MKRGLIIVYACVCFLAGCGEDEEERSVVVTEFYPKKSTASATVVIHGKNFSTNPTGNIVTINGTQALVLQTSPEVLHIKVPQTATSGELSVTTGGKTKTPGSIEIVEAEGSWEQKATFPGTWRQSPASFSHNGYGYIGLGYDDQQFIDLWRYDAAADQWTQLNDAVIDTEHNAFTVVSTFVADGVAHMLCYSFEIGEMSILKYDIEQDEWEWQESAVPFPATLYSSITARADSDQGMFGYFTSNGTGGYTLPIYDIETKAWSFSSIIPGQWSSPGQLGGVGQPRSVWFQDSKAFSVTDTTLYEYTIATNTWQQKPVTSYPSLANRYPVTVALNESVYFAMSTTHYLLIGDVWKYTPATDVWTPVTPCPSITGQPSSFTINNKIYFVLGQPAYEFGSSGNKNLATMMLTP